MTANNEVLRRPEFAPLLADIGSMPPACDRAQLANRSSFWFGPAGTITPLHHDTIMLFHTQVVGRKRWRFISPLDTPSLYNHFEVYSPIDLDNPEKSKIVKLIDMGTDAAKGPNAVHANVRKAEREALRDEELRGFRAPSDQECGQQHAREGPQRRERGASRLRHRTE